MNRLASSPEFDADRSQLRLDADWVVVLNLGTTPRTFVIDTVVNAEALGARETALEPAEGHLGPGDREFLNLVERELRGEAQEAGVDILREVRRKWPGDLIRTDNIGPRTFRDLINHYGGARAALAALPALARRGGASAPARICSREDAEAELKAARVRGIEFVALGEPDYPPRLAGEQGREVFAVPGSPLDPRAEGTNGLLKQGATLVTEAADVIAVLEPNPGARLRCAGARA